MATTDELEKWIQPQHLQASNMASYRESLNDSYSQLCEIADFLQPQVFDRLYHYARDEASYERSYGLYPTFKGVSQAEWDAAPVNKRGYTKLEAIGVQPKYTLSPNHLTFRKFLKALTVSPLIDYFSTLAQQPLAHESFALAASSKKDVNNKHSDRARGRQVCAVLYLTSNWHDSYGGEIKFWDADGAPLFSTNPTPNKIVLFKLNTPFTHSVAEIAAAAGDEYRYCIVLWFKGSGEDVQQHTTFRRID